MDDVERETAPSKYVVDVDAVADSIARQLFRAQMWVKYPDVAPLDTPEMFVAPQPGNLAARPKHV